MPNPTTGGACTDVSSLDVAGLLTAGTTTYNNLVATLNSIASGIASLQSSQQPVIFRPLHKANTAQFWWGTSRLPDAQFVTLWRFIYDYLTITKGLTNIIWMFSVVSGISSNLPM